jgi:hypothetical protein
MSLDAMPPSAIPVVTTIVAGVIGILLWRLFKLAMKVVAFIVFLIVLGGVIAWWQPGLVGLGKDVVESQLGAPLPTREQASQKIKDELAAAAKETARDMIRDQVGQPPSPPSPPEPTK